MALSYFFPPRPHGKIDPRKLEEYEKMRWWAQWKYNGTRTLVFIEPDRTVRLYQRTGEPHVAYTLTDATRGDLLSLALGNEAYVLDGELMHSKTKDIKDIIVLYDLLFAGHYLYGTTVRHRYDMLREICGNPAAWEPGGRALLVRDHLWLAPFFTGGLVERFAQTQGDEAREGLVLKQPDGILRDFGGREYDVDWQIRCRKPKKNYRW